MPTKSRCHARRRLQDEAGAELVNRTSQTNRGTQSLQFGNEFHSRLHGSDSAEISAKLRSLGVSVKDIGDVLDYKGCLRATVGTRPMNEKLLNALEEVMSDGQI